MVVPRSHRIVQMKVNEPPAVTLEVRPHGVAAGVAGQRRVAYVDADPEGRVVLGDVEGSVKRAEGVHRVFERHLDATTTRVIQHAANLGNIGPVGCVIESEGLGMHDQRPRAEPVRKIDLASESSRVPGPIAPASVHAEKRRAGARFDDVPLFERARPRVVGPARRPDLDPKTRIELPDRENGVRQRRPRILLPSGEEAVDTRAVPQVHRGPC